jgi:hypothetical protein
VNLKNNNKMKRHSYIVLLILWFASCNLTVKALENSPVDSNAYVTNSLWDNLYGQIGVDMWLQNPYGSNFKNVFPNGKSYGVDVAYQFTPNEFVQGKTISRHSGSTGWFDFNVGVQYEIGQAVGWDKPGDKKRSVQTIAGHNWPRFIVNTGASVVVAYGAKTALKGIIKEERPDHSDNKSFPSGHASMAFAAARSIDKEFRQESIWIPIAGYAAATAVGIERVARDRHHWYDVLAGAGVGIGATELTWWLSDKLFGKGSNVAVGTSGTTVDVAVGF